jgi:hypothetical protein
MLLSDFRGPGVDGSGLDFGAYFVGVLSRNVAILNLEAACSLSYFTLSAASFKGPLSVCCVSFSSAKCFLLKFVTFLP